MGSDGGQNNSQFVVAGVLEPGFELNDEVMQTVANIRQIDAYLPLPLGADAVNRRGDENYNLTGRLRPGVTLEQAQADIGAIAARIRDKDKRDQTFTISVVSRQEIGVRMALGAQRGRIIGMVMRQGLQLTAAGTILGLAGAAALSRVMATLLFGISATDLVTFSLVPLVLVAVAVLACFVPAFRATTVDPQVALRVE
jgi:hypothetical protein